MDGGFLQGADAGHVNLSAVLGHQLVDLAGFFGCDGVHVGHPVFAFGEVRQAHVVGGVEFAGGWRATEFAGKFGMDDGQVVGGIGLIDESMHHVQVVGIDLLPAGPAIGADVRPGSFGNLVGAQGAAAIAIELAAIVRFHMLDGAQ